MDKSDSPVERRQILKSAGLGLGTGLLFGFTPSQALSEEPLTKPRHRRRKIKKGSTWMRPEEDDELLETPHDLWRDEDVTWLLGAGRRDQLAAGTVIVRQNEKLDELLIVLDGAVSVHMHDGEVSSLGYASLIGEISFFTDAPAAATLVADQQATVFRIAKSVLHERAAADHEFALRLNKILASTVSSRLSHVLVGERDSQVPAEQKLARIKLVMDRLTAV